jgi:hypothetical protein
MGRQLENVVGQSGGEQSDFDVRGKELEDLLNLDLKAAREHLVSFVKHELLQIVGLEKASLHQVSDAARGGYDYVDAFFERLFVAEHGFSAHANVDFDATEFANTLDDTPNLRAQLARIRQNKALCDVVGRVDVLKAPNSKRACFTGSRLCLGNCILSLDDRNNSFLLDRRRFFETMAVNASKQVFPQTHIVKLVDACFPISFKNGFVHWLGGLSIRFVSVLLHQRRVRKIISFNHKLYLINR